MMMSRSVTPTKIPAPIDTSSVPMDTRLLYLDVGELLASRGYPAPTRNNKEIRKCISCKDIYLIVLKDSPKTCCGYCTHIQTSNDK